MYDLASQKARKKDYTEPGRGLIVRDLALDYTAAALISMNRILCCGTVIRIRYLLI